MRGEVFAVMGPGSTEARYYVENVELVRCERRTVKLFQGNERVLLGFASWGLREQDGTTTVTYDVYVQYPRPATSVETMSDGECEAVEAAEHSARFKEELESLKRIVENTP
jgi:hypothetical protein